MKTEITTDPFEQGFKKGLIGEDPRSCPYEWGKEWQAWQRGQSLGIDLMEALGHVW
jgi:hypothetical protein